MANGTGCRHRKRSRAFAVLMLLLYFSVVAVHGYLLYTDGNNLVEPLVILVQRVIVFLFGWLFPGIGDYFDVINSLYLADIVIWAVAFLIALVFIVACKAYWLARTGSSLVMLAVYCNLVISFIQGLVIASAFKFDLDPDPGSFSESVLVVLNVLISFVMGFVPIVGTLGAAYGATELWAWRRIVALSIFALPLIAFLLILAYSHFHFLASANRCGKDCCEATAR